MAANLLAINFGISAIFFCLLILLGSAFWIWMIVDCATSSSLDSNEKLVWMLVIIFVHFIGAFIYFVAGRGSRRR